MKIKRILWSIVLAWYLASNLLSYLWYVDRWRAEAASNWSTNRPIVAVLVDNDTYSQIWSSSNFSWYTNDYLHSKYPDSQAIVLSLDTNEYTAPEIVKLLENLYFEGIENEPSRLVWVILVWKIPFPVVKYQNFVFPSIYPYVDFIEQKYIRDEEQKYFVQNNENWEAELWHGVLDFSDASKYEEFFEKLKKYQDNPEKFIDKKIWYDDFIALNKNFLEEIYHLYQNKLIFAEDLMYHRYTNFFVNILQQEQEDSYSDLLTDLETATQITWVQNILSWTQEALESISADWWDTPTLLLQNKINWFLKDYYNVLSTPLLRTIDDNVKASDRWEVSDSHFQKMQIKDQLLLWNDETNGIIKSINDKLEEFVDKKIADEKYAMKTTVPTYYSEEKKRWKKKWPFGRKLIPDKNSIYQMFYFGQNPETITNAQQFSIYRWSYRNLDKYVKYSSITWDALNPAQTRQDKTDLSKKGLWSSYDIFSTQVEANRGYNVLNMQTEYEEYNQYKIHAKRSRECTKYWFWIKFFWCKRKEWVKEWNCDQNDDSWCENFLQYWERVYWWGTPLNLNMTKYQEQVYEFDWPFHYENAVKPLYDIAWSVKTKSNINDATSFKASKTFLSPVLINDVYWEILADNWELAAPFHIGINKVRFFGNSDLNFSKFRFTKFSDDFFELRKEKSWRTDEERVYRYKIIPSVIKHDAAQSLLINGYSWYRYTWDKETYIYYTSILETLQLDQDTWATKILQDAFSGLNTILSWLATKIETTDVLLSWEIKLSDSVTLSWLVNYTGAVESFDLSDQANTSWEDLIKGQSWDQSKNWDLFNSVFLENYWENAISYIEGYQNRQMDTKSPIDIWSKWFNEILTQMTTLSNTLRAMEQIGIKFFDDYNTFVKELEDSEKKVDENIEILEARILSGQQAIEENSGAIASWNETILESNWEIARLSWEIERLTQEISDLNTLIAWYANDETNKQNALAAVETNRTNELNVVEKKIRTSQWIIAQKNSIITAYENKINYYNTEIGRRRDLYNQNITAANRTISDQNAIIATNSWVIERYTNLKNSITATWAEKARLEREYDGYISEAMSKISAARSEIARAESIIEENTTLLEWLPAEEERLNQEKEDFIAANEENYNTAKTEKQAEEAKLSGYEAEKTSINNNYNSQRDTIISNYNRRKQEKEAYEAQVKAKESAIRDANSGIDEANADIEEANATITQAQNDIKKAEEEIELASGAKAKWEEVKLKIEDILTTVNDLNMADECTANHGVLWNILWKDDEEINYWTESDDPVKCDIADWWWEGWEWWESWDGSTTISALLDSIVEAKKSFQEHFKSDPNNPEEHIPWMNMLTVDRPIDSPRYVTFQWVWENVIKLIYPNLFKVEVYKSTWSNIILKETNPNPSKDEIYQALKSYFQNKVSEYNQILSNEKNHAKSMDKYYTFLRDKMDPLATPTLNQSVRPYNPFTYQEMIKVIWWDEMLYTLSELLYYQNVSNRMREYLDDIGDDIDETRSTFDINKKIWYIVKNYLTEENDKFYKWELNAGDKKSYAGLIIPWYSTWWYEVWYINSNGNDNVTPWFDDTENRIKEASTGWDDWDGWVSGSLFAEDPSDAEATQEFKKECWFDINQALLLYSFESWKFEWFEWLTCWLKQVAKKPLTVEIYFPTAPTLSSITEPIEESLTDFKDNMQQFWNEMEEFLAPAWSTIETYKNMPVTKNMDEKTKQAFNYTQVSWNDKKVSVLDWSWSINFLSLQDVWNITVKIQTTWDNCLIVKGTNTCNWTEAVKTWNPYKSWFSIDYTLAKETVWNIIASVSICTSASSCWVKTMSLSVVPWPIDKLTVTPQWGNKILAWAYTLLSLKATDAKDNAINRTLENYIIKVDKWKLINWGVEDTKQEVNDFQNTTLLYRAEPGTAWTVEFTVEDEKWNVLTREYATILNWELALEYNWAKVSSMKYTISNEKYFNDDGSINTKKVIPIKVSLKNGWSIVPITTNAVLWSEKWLISPMILQKTKRNDGTEKLSLRQANSINILSWTLTIYVVPWYKAWDDNLIVSIPWMADKKIAFKLLPWEIRDIGITLEKDTIDIWESISGTINLVDARGNKIDKATNISVDVTTENMIDPNGKMWKAAVSPTRYPQVYSWEQSISLKTTENDAGLQRLTVKAKNKDWDEITTTKSFMVRKFFLDWAIESWLNILYLNLFWSDWWNQWWYGSDNKKFSEHIIESSKKTLAVTTQLVDPSKIKETSIVFWKSWHILNNDNLSVTAHLNNAKLQLDIDKVGSFEIKDPLKNIKAIKNDVGNEWLLELAQWEEKSLLLYDISEDFIYNNGIFYTQRGLEFANMRTSVNFNLTTNSIWNYPIWEATSNGQILGFVLITNLDYSTITWDAENIDYELWDLYENWGTTDTIKALYSSLNTLADSYQGYTSIQDSADFKNYVGFRGDFKNITLFAEWESVWEATVPYWSEFLINIWDPLLKNRDEVASVRGLGQVKFSNPWKTISKVIDIDYNNDWLRDFIIIYKDWSIVLQKQYENKKYQDLGTLMVSAEQIKEVYVWDVDWNKYEDIIVRNTNNQLRVYINDNWVFDVDWNIVCLNTNIPTWEINEHPEDLSGVLQIFIDDMDNDWRTDIVTLDKRWYVKIFYGYWSKNRHSYLSKEIYSCDENRYERNKWQTKIVKKLWLKLDSKGVADSSILRWDNLKYPSDEDLEKAVIDGNMEDEWSETELEKLGISTDPDFLKQLEKWFTTSDGSDQNVVKSEMNAIIGDVVNVSSEIDTTAQAQKVTEAWTLYIKNPFVGKYVFKDTLKEEEQAFITMSNIENYRKLTNTKKINKPEKKYVDVNWWELEEWDIVEVTVSSTAQAWFIPTSFFDQITGPWMIDRDQTTGAPKNLKFTRWTWEIVAGAEWYDYWLINIKPSGNWFQVKYSLTYHMEKPLYTIRVEREDPLISLQSVKNIEKDDISIVNWNGLKYESRHQDILIKNPFTNKIKITDGLEPEEQAYININNIWTYIDRLDSREIYSINKKYVDINGNSLENGDKIEVTVKISMPKSHIHLNTYFEKLEGPWAEKWIPSNVQFTKWKWETRSWIWWYNFYLTNFEEEKVWEEEYVIEFKYTLTYKDENWTPDTKNLPYIVLQPTDGCVKQEELLKNSLTNKNRSYKSEIIDLQELAKTYAEEVQKPNDEATDAVNDQINNAMNLWTDSPLLNLVQETFWTKDIFDQASWTKIVENNWIDFWSIDLDITEMLGVDVQQLQRNVQDLANKLCNWFTFWKKGKKSCEGLPVPFNQAFLAPGSYHVMWCFPVPPLTATLGKWLPIFFWPWNLGPIPFVWFLPIPYMPTGAGDNFLRLKWAWPFSSLIRIYAAPTLTAQLWLAICVGPYNAWINMPSPVADIAWNCIVTAMALPCWSWWSGDWDDDWNDWNWAWEDEVYENWVSEYWKTNTCVPSNDESPFQMVGNNWALNASEGSSIGWSSTTYLWGNVSIHQDTFDLFGEEYERIDPANDSSIFEKWKWSWLEINWVRIQWVSDMKNKLLWGLQQGIQKILVDWLDRQVQYWINNLFRFEIEFTFPDISYLSDEIKKISADNVSDITSPVTDENGKVEESNKWTNDWSDQKTQKAKKIQSSNKKATLTWVVDSVKKFNIVSDKIKELDLAWWVNPFKELEELFNQTDLINITTQNIPIRVPWIYNEDIEAYKNYLLTWYDQNLTIIKWWDAAIEAAIADCSSKEEDDQWKIRSAAHCKALQDAKAKLMRLSSKFDKTWDQIFANVQTLEAYKRFPFQIYEWLHVVDKYLWDVSALITNFFWYINYWMDINATRFTQYVDAIITIVAIVKTYQIMIDLFTSRWSKCWKCTQDTYDQYSCKLSFLCMINIPTIAIPAVKIPSLYIDLSHLNLQMNITLPRFTFKPEGIELPRLPTLPEPPQLGINFDIDFDIPDIPQLPQPPELPELPSFIPQVKMELPVLPPAPAIPEIPSEITAILNLAKTLSKIFCIIKSWIGLVSESAVKARIEQMTQRSYEVPWVDNLDLTAYFKQTPLQWVDIQVDSFVNLQFNFDAFYAVLKGIVDEINELTYNVSQVAQNGVNYVNQTSADWTQEMNDATNKSVNFDFSVSKAETPSKLKKELIDLRNTMTDAEDKKMINEVIAYTSTDTTVKKNSKGLKKLEKQVNEIIESEKESLESLWKRITSDYDGFLASLNTQQNEEAPLQLSFSTNLLEKNEAAEKAIMKNDAKDILIRTEEKNVDGYINALNNHSPSDLNMTEETYNNSLKYLASIKGTIDKYYSIKRNEYIWGENLTDSMWNTVNKPLYAQADNTTPSATEMATEDYSQYVKGVFIKSWDNLINAVNSEYNYEKFHNYYEKDLDKDGKTELIMWDDNNLFVKYFDRQKNASWKSSITIKPSLKDKKKYSWWGLFWSDVKIYDENSEVKNFKLKWQTYESISFSRDNDHYANTSWYLMRLVEHVEWFREKTVAAKNTTKYILLLPNEMEWELKGLQLQVQWNTIPLSSDKLYAIKYYNSDDDSLQVTLWEVPRKWEYAQITTVKLNNRVFQQNAPWSNQLVWGRQVVWDWAAPKATVELLRSKKWDEIVSEGFDLEWFVWTYYTLQITWNDSTKVRNTKLEVFDEKTNTGKILNEKDFDSFVWIVRLENLFFTWAQTKQYNIYAVDSQGNETEETINLEINIPDITISNIERSEGYKEWIKWPVSITSELETDIDEWTVSFERNRNSVSEPISSTSNWAQKQNYDVTTNQTTVVGQYYDLWDEVGLYSEDNNQIATIDAANGKIELKPEFASMTETRVDFSQWYPIVKIMQGSKVLFEILLQPQSLISKQVEEWYSVLQLQGNNYGLFNWWEVIMKNKSPLLYIAPDWTLFTQSPLQWNYTYNAWDDTVTYDVYETLGDKVASITFKVKPLE